MLHYCVIKHQFSFNPFNIQKRKIDNVSTTTSLSLAFLTKQLPLAALFPYKSGLEKPNLLQDTSSNKFQAENLASGAKQLLFNLGWPKRLTPPSWPIKKILNSNGVTSFFN